MRRPAEPRVSPRASRAAVAGTWAAGNEWGPAGGAVGTVDRRGDCVYLPMAGQMGGGRDPGRGPAPAVGSPPRCHVPPASGSARTRCSLRLRGAPSHGGTRARPRWGADTGAGRASRPRALSPPGLDPGHCAAAPPPGSLRLRPAPCRWRLSDVSTAPPPLPASGCPARVLPFLNL